MAALCAVCGEENCRRHWYKGRPIYRTEQAIYMEKKDTMLRLTERVYLNADKTKVVGHNDPEAAFLLGTRGSLISEDDAKRLGVKATEKHEGELVNAAAPLRAQLAAVPVDPNDDSLYDDQTERGKASRKAAREMQTQGVYEYVKSTGGSDDEAEQAEKESTGEAAPQGPSIEEQQKQNASLTGEAARKK
jgi:hypothetical protein